MISSPFADPTVGNTAAISLRTEPSKAPSVEPSAESISRKPPNVRNRRSDSIPAALGSSISRSPDRYKNGVSCSVSEAGVTIDGSSSTSIDVRFSSSHAILRSALGRGPRP